MGSCAAPSAKGDDKFITTDYLQQCPDAFVVAVDAEVAADFCDAAAFVSDVFAAPALVAAALFEDSAAAALF
ncbi:hypothetical protein ACRWFX_26210, partial [Escherichia coli]